jgi:hypothetical protein
VQREITQRGTRVKEGGYDVDLCVDAVHEINNTPLFDELDDSIRNCFAILNKPFVAPSTPEQNRHAAAAGLAAGGPVVSAFADGNVSAIREDS